MYKTKSIICEKYLSLGLLKNSNGMASQIFYNIHSGFTTDLFWGKFHYLSPFFIYNNNNKKL